ncbi:MAG: thioredoxin domain-containing protein [Bacteroidetes bacterium]|nr:thioredoxin domain-containing protein [Bacteroidota bacterium]
MAKESPRKQRAKKQQQTDYNRTALWVATGFAALGAALAYYATNMTFTIESQGLVEASGCTLSDFVNCDVASASSYAKMLGVPVAWWGFLFYLFAGLSAVVGVTSNSKAGSAPFLAASFVLSLFSILFTFVKAYHLFSLGVLCLVCVGMYVANFGIAVSLGLGLGFGPGGWGSFLGAYVAGVKGNTEKLGYSPQIVRVAVVSVLVFGIGFAGALNHQRDLTGTSGFDLKLAVDAHFRQVPIEVQTNEKAAIWGNPEADITIVEFADFQCPACRESAFHLRPALFEFQKDVKLVFMNYPLDSNFNTSMETQLHAMAGPAAMAGVCAEEFGDFWGYHDLIFRDQGALTNQLLTKSAEALGWDPLAFAQCIVRDDVRARVLSDLAMGQLTQLGSTPTLFLNGRKLTYWRNTDFIRAVINEQRSRS